MLLLYVSGSIGYNVLWLCDVAEKKTPKTLNLRLIMKAQNNVTVQEQNGNSTKRPLGEGIFCGLPCQNCKHKNSVTVGNGWNSTRCRLQPHKDFWQIKAEDDFVGCGFQPFT